MKNVLYAAVLIGVSAVVGMIIADRVNAVYGTEFNEKKEGEVLVLEPEESIEQKNETEEKMQITECKEEKPLYYTESDAEMIAKTLWGECRGVKSKMEQAAVAWCILNRVDDSSFGDTIKDVITAPYQFIGYKESNPVSTPLLELAKDVLERWLMEKNGVPDVGRVLPKEYVYFFCDMGVNYFQDEWQGRGAWVFDCANPYED